MSDRFLTAICLFLIQFGRRRRRSSPRTRRPRHAALKREHLLETRPVGHGRLQDRDEPPRRELGVDEVVGQVGAPLIEPGAVEDVIAWGLPGVEQIAIGVMLVLLAPRIAPVVEDLAAEEMPPDAPGVTVLARHHHLLAHLDGVQVDNLEGDVIDLRLESQGGLRQFLKVVEAGGQEAQSEQARLQAARHAADEGPRARPAQEKLLSDFETTTSEPLMAVKKLVERRVAMRRRDGRLRRHLADQSVFPSRRERAAVNGGWRYHAAPADEGAEAT